jgi:D-glycero-alpha-D-manno-heptose 1-phosphate guanylyltransferase
MITEAIILAGGLGTRLKPVVADLPKSLAPIHGKPFLSYLLDYCTQQGIQKFIFALGHKSDQIETFVNQYRPGESYLFSRETEPLGTGGAIYLATKQVDGSDVLVLNADTFFGISFLNLTIIHELSRAACTLSLKPMKDFDRYGAVKIDQHRVTGFSEKKYHTEGLINGGVYALDVAAFRDRTKAGVFSFEKDYLEKAFREQPVMAMVSDAYFIDIGIPADYEKAQTELTRGMQLSK